jgi:predicted RNase H-like nuclease (RuvC/YqgF family)
LLNNNINQSINKNNEKEEIIKLKNDLIKANKIIEDQNKKIKELEYQLNNKNEKYEKQLRLKDKKIDELNKKLENLIINSYMSDQLINRKQMICVNFTSMDQKINLAISCIKTDIFAEIEEKLYKEYPEYRETNNYFLANGKQILRFKTIEDNKIGNGLPVILNKPE